MHNLFAVYDCPTCGEKLVDEVDAVASIDTKRDSSELQMYCTGCGGDVTRRRSYDITTRKEIPVLFEVSLERAEAFRLSCNEDDDDDEYVDYGDPYDDFDLDGDFDDEDDEPEAMTDPYDVFCPGCGVQYDEIDVDFQVCHLCGHDNG